MNKRFSLLALVLGFFLIVPSALAAGPHRTKINRYVWDYQMVKKGNRIEERRVIIRENGRSATDGKKMLEEKRFHVLRPLTESKETESYFPAVHRFSSNIPLTYGGAAKGLNWRLRSATINTNSSPWRPNTKS
jgi:hypothetical protein